MPVSARPRTAPPSPSPSTQALVRALREVGTTADVDLPGPTSPPAGLAAAIAQAVPGVAKVVVTGPVERRLLALRPEADSPRWLLADLSDRVHASRPWPWWADRDIHLDAPHAPVSWADLDERAAKRLTGPRLLLVGLYKPEVFPLPRFSLSVHDIARAARVHLTGAVDLLDMQLGTTVDEVVTAATAPHGPAEVVGLSATFGQHDLLTELIEALLALPCPPMVLAGGSLSARNEDLITREYPEVIVGRAAGEPMIADVLDHWHHDLDRSRIRLASRPRGTLPTGPAVRRKSAPDTVLGHALPELDLLHQTLDHGGVAQLETSRGCTSACSFCPRGHKGSWHGDLPENLPEILRLLDDAYTAHPETARVLYLVDEEFVGDGPEAVARALDVAAIVHRAGFDWETSCRIDQVVRTDTDHAWHERRVRMWRELGHRGLRRCLFGVESGVDSILQRFAKDTTVEQNVLAVRTLSLLGVPTRFTYITFDPLMDLAELRATTAFQARTDLLLRPDPALSAADVVDAVRDPDYVAAHAAGQPLWTEIPYMLVSMECLTGSAYTRRAAAEHLTGAEEPSMGRVEVRYRDWRIGAASQHAQRWIDRNFSLDYTLKSLEKTLAGPTRSQVRSARTVLKAHAHDVLTDLIALIDRYDTSWTASEAPAAMRDVLTRHHQELRPAVTAVVTDLSGILPARSAHVLTAQHRRWQDRQDWELINPAATAC